MPSFSRRPIPLKICLIAIVMIAAIHGWFVPALYEWSGADQSRWTSRATLVVWGKLFVAIIFWAALPWIDIRVDEPQLEKPKSQFNIRFVLIVAAFAATGIAMLRLIPWVTSGCLAALGYLAMGTCMWKYPRNQWSIATLWLVMILPFCWMWRGFAIEQPLLAVIGVLAGLPSLVCQLIFCQLTGQNHHEMTWLMYAMTGIQILIGLWVICRCGPKLTLAYLVGVLLCSLLGSTIIDAGARI